MKQQITFSFLNNFSLKIIFTTFTIIASCNSYGQLLYSNGPISTGATHLATSTTAPAGYTWSELQTPSSSFGSGMIYNNALTSNFALADDFVVPAFTTWNITSVNVYGYQTGYAGTTAPPIDVLRIRIWNGDPALPTSTVVYGDMTTNVLNLAGSGEEFIYRVSGTTGTTRRVYRFNALITAALTPGTYWIEYQVHATNDGSIFVPPVTILGTQSDPSWNAKQRNATTWAPVIDAGSTFNKAIPFQINGGGTLGVNSNDLASSFKMWPMPAKDVCHFKLNENTSLSAKLLSIYDVKGALVLNQSIEINNADVSVDVSSLEAGIYVVKIKDAEGKSIFINQLIKE